MLPQHVHGLSQAGSGLGPEESTSSMASGMIGKYGNTRDSNKGVATAQDVS